MFVAKVGPTGKFLWARTTDQAGLHQVSYGRGISTGSTGNSYVTGEFTDTAIFGSTSLSSRGGQDTYVAKVAPTGKFLWAITIGGTSYFDECQISVDGTDHSYITGRFEDSMTFGSTTLTAEQSPC